MRHHEDGLAKQIQRRQKALDATFCGAFQYFRLTQQSENSKVNAEDR